MNAEIICVGNELLSGITLNTNAHWLAGQISRAGGTVQRVTIIRDQLEAISVGVLEAISRKPAVLIITGGLGATYDDMTLEGVAHALGKKVSLDDRAVTLLKESYSHRGLHYELTKSRLKMATIPEGSTPLLNTIGSAPAVRLRASRTDVFCLQGVPAEMQAAFHKYVLPMVKRSVGRFTLREAKFEVTGITEAMLAPGLARVVSLHSKKMIYIKTHPRGYKGKTPRLMVRIISTGANPQQVESRLERVTKAIENETMKIGGSWAKAEGAPTT